MVPALARSDDDIVVGDDRFELDLWERTDRCVWEVRAIGRGDRGRGHASSRHEAIAEASRWCVGFVDEHV